MLIHCLTIALIIHQCIIGVMGVRVGVGLLGGAHARGLVDLVELLSLFLFLQ